MMVEPVEFPNPAFGVIPSHRFAQAFGYRYRKPVVVTR